MLFGWNDSQSNGTLSCYTCALSSTIFVLYRAARLSTYVARVPNALRNWLRCFVFVYESVHSCEGRMKAAPWLYIIPGVWIYKSVLQCSQPIRLFRYKECLYIVSDIQVTIPAYVGIDLGIGESRLYGFSGSTGCPEPFHISGLHSLKFSLF